MKKLITGFLTISLLGFCAIASAEESVKMITDHVPSASELGNLLFKSKANSSPDEEEEGSRSVSFKKKKMEPVAPQPPQAVGLLINFESGKDVLMQDSLPILEQTGEMLINPEYANRSMKIEGHTDAVGSKQANLELSKRRAVAVKQYLVEKFNIASERLIAEGYGEDHPLAGANPYDGKNRRVQFEAQ
jgi:outer membrane protein OmpA-like peptidoglycan-associated protein